jgi:hypothetical protein
MTLELIRTSEPDGLWLKILRDGFTVKCWQVPHGSEYTAHIEAEVYFDRLVESTKKMEILKSVII